MTRTGTQLSAPLWRASGTRCPTPRVPLACPQLAWDVSHLAWPLDHRVHWQEPGRLSPL